ncbi:GNAT family N-acetyltransferase [Devosia sp. 1635]|uniref:GNAT family N-acetyltransferase n=1 Tax=Devosia sp. 1635 TaxID=2726066 RepID=UPI001566746D|nr:GNAT family N-acetyltransferase [Devosia sp. 1635]
MEIRKATHADAENGSAVLRRSITELCEADHGGDQAAIAAWCANKTPEMWRTWVDQQATQLYVAVEAGKILGVGMLGNTGDILLNYVSPDARWRGVSKAMVAHIESEARKIGLPKCTLKSSKTAHAFYEAVGYQDTGDGNVMTKDLNP